MIYDFGDLFLSIRNGMNVKQDKDGQGLPISRIETISTGVVNPAKVGYAGLNLQDARNWLLEYGDILFSHINSAELVGKCAVYRQEPAQLVHGMNLLCLRPDPSRLDSNYAQWLIRSTPFRGCLSNFINKAVNQASVSIGNLRKIKVEIPSVQEQRRIAAILDQAEALRAKRRHALAKLDTLTQALFLEMFGDPDREGNAARASKIGDVCTRITYGFTSPMRHITQGIPILTAKHIQRGWIDFSSVHYAEQEQFDQLTAKCKPREGDVLITKDGTIGRCAVLHGDDPVCINQSVALVQVDRNLIIPEFFSAFVNLDQTQRKLDGMGKGNSIRHLQITEFARFAIAVPTLQLQKRFLQRIEKVKTLRAALENQLERLVSAQLSLQHRAFRGEL